MNASYGVGGNMAASGCIESLIADGNAERAAGKRLY
jgi:hypothetical protein